MTRIAEHEKDCVEYKVQDKIAIIIALVFISGCLLGGLLYMMKILGIN